jgi:hypothetical protein
MQQQAEIDVRPYKQVLAKAEILGWTENGCHRQRDHRHNLRDRTAGRDFSGFVRPAVLRVSHAPSALPSGDDIMLAQPGDAALPRKPFGGQVQSAE